MLFLNETGDPRLDYLTVEHNAPLAPVGAEAKAFAGMVEGLLTDTDWDELCLGWVEADRWRACWLECSHLPLMPVVIDRRPYYFRGLQSRDARPDQLLSSLSSNTRQQIRRSIRQYGGLDALAFEVATDPAMAVRWFEHMVELHQARWQAQGKVGAFADPFMRAFHEHLIEAGAQDGSARMIRVQTSERVIGYLYNLRAGGYECNYQSGLAYEADPRSKPGLVSHILAMAAAAETGVHCYDFLVGESQYKRSLASGKGEMLRVSLQRRRPMLWLERQLRAARDRILQKRGRERKEAW
ncbi:GNAT family N-acetyltransferase [Halorhodospira halophila]|nr:GNAT family N-acetyltransferase [Halorhodospira halophila]